MCRSLRWCGIASFLLAATLRAQSSDQEVIRQLIQRLAESERRIQALEQKLGMTSSAPASEASAVSSAVSAVQPAPTQVAPATPPTPAPALAADAGTAASAMQAQADAMQ